VKKVYLHMHQVVMNRNEKKKKSPTVKCPLCKTNCGALLECPKFCTYQRSLTVYRIIPRSETDTTLDAAPLHLLSK
jgi:hypothetical protein